MSRCFIAEYLSQDMVVAIDQVYNVLGGVEVKSLRVRVPRCTEVQDHLRGCQPLAAQYHPLCLI